MPPRRDEVHHEPEEPHDAPAFAQLSPRSNPFETSDARPMEAFDNL